MGNTTYKELADGVFRKIKDSLFAEFIDEKIAYDIVIGYLQPAIVMFDSCKQDLSDRDDDLQEFNFPLTDDSIVILCNYMTIEWLTSEFIMSRQSLKARLSTSDYHKIDTKDMLGKAMELRTMLKKENDQLAINKSYKGSKLYDIVTNKKTNINDIFKRKV